MVRKWPYFLFVVASILNSCSAEGDIESNTKIPTIVPTPSKILKRSGSITLDNNFWVIANVSDSASSKVARYLVDRLDQIIGTEAYITDLYSTRKHKQSIQLEISDIPMEQGPNGYVLDVTSAHIKIKAQNEAGLYYGIQSFLILLNGSKKDNKTFIVRKCVIKDKPLFAHRGILVKGSITNDELSELARLATEMKFTALYYTAPPEPEKSISKFNYPITLNESAEIQPDASVIMIDIDKQDLNSVKINNNGRQKIVFMSSSYKQIMSKLRNLSAYGWSGKTAQ